jgi:hypothetical protein
MTDQLAMKDLIKEITKEMAKELGRDVATPAVSYAFYYYVFFFVWYLLIGVTCLCIIWYVLYTAKWVGSVKAKDDVIAEGDNTWGSMETLISNGAQIVQKLNQSVTGEVPTQPTKKRITKKEEATKPE